MVRAHPTRALARLRISNDMPLRRPGRENADCLHIRGEILKGFLRSGSAKTGFENRFSVRIFPPRPPKRHCRPKLVAAHLTGKTHPARALAFQGVRGKE